MPMYMAHFLRSRERNVRSKKYKPFTELRVFWLDIVSDARWTSKIDIEKAESIEMKTLGMFLQNTKKDLKLAHTLSPDGDSDYTIIPWATITKIEVI